MTLTLLLLVSLSAICYGMPAELDPVELEPALDPKIVGGRNAKPGEIPYQVSLQNIPSGRHFCGGVILNENYVLTAAHCMIEDVSRISVTVGTTNLTRPYKVHLIESAYVHEEYDISNSWINDIALLKLQTKLTFNNLVGPVVLPKQNQLVRAGAIAVISGYGRLSYDEFFTSEELNLVNIRIADMTYCRSMYKKFSKDVNNTAHLCANDPTVKKGSCKGDSGGPLTVNGQLVGLSSWSYLCSDTQYPSVYTRVPTYVNWIKLHAK